VETQCGDKGYALYALRRKEGVALCNVKEQGTGGTNRQKFTIIHPEIGIKGVVAANKMNRISGTVIVIQLNKYLVYGILTQCGICHLSD
jgi:hypothetical protein